MENGDEFLYKKLGKKAKTEGKHSGRHREGAKGPREGRTRDTNTARNHYKREHTNKSGEQLNQSPSNERPSGSVT